MTDHTHDVRDLSIDVAPLDHDHSYLDVHGVAQEHHSHTAADLGGVPSLADIRELRRALEALEQRFEAERIAVAEAIAEGNRGSAERIAAAIERRCDLMAGFDQHTYLRTQLRELAREIRESGRRSAT